MTIIINPPNKITGLRPKKKLKWQRKVQQSKKETTGEEKKIKIFSMMRIRTIWESIAKSNRNKIPMLNFWPITMLMKTKMIRKRPIQSRKGSIERAKDKSLPKSHNRQSSRNNHPLSAMKNNRSDHSLRKVSSRKINNLKSNKKKIHK